MLDRCVVQFFDWNSCFHFFPKLLYSDPQKLPPKKAIETIGKTLQTQYIRWLASVIIFHFFFALFPTINNPFLFYFFTFKGQYKFCLDPTKDDVKKLCQMLRVYVLLIFLFKFIIHTHYTHYITLYTHYTHTLYLFYS